MSKKVTIKSALAKPAAATAKKTTPVRKPKAKAVIDSKLTKTILNSPQAKNMGNRAKATSEAANSFMRTTAFTMQNKVRTAMTALNKIDKPEKLPSANLDMSYDSSIYPTSNSWLSKPFNRFKIAFLAVVILGAIGGSMYSDRLLDGFGDSAKSIGSIFSEETFVKGMLTQTNGIPDGNDKDGTLMPPRMLEENVVPAAEEKVASPSSDVIPTEAPAVTPAPVAAPAAAIAAPAKVENKAVKSAKTSKKSKAKVKSAKGKKSKSKVANK